MAVFQLVERRHTQRQLVRLAPRLVTLHFASDVRGYYVHLVSSLRKELSNLDYTTMVEAALLTEEGLIMLVQVFRVYGRCMGAL